MMPNHAMMSAGHCSDGNHALTMDSQMLTSSHYSNGSHALINDPQTTQQRTVPVDGLSAVATGVGYGLATTPSHSPRSNPMHLGGSGSVLRGTTDFSEGRRQTGDRKVAADMSLTESVEATTSKRQSKARVERRAKTKSLSAPESTAAAAVASDQKVKGGTQPPLAGDHKVAAAFPRARRKPDLEKLPETFEATYSDLNARTEDDKPTLLNIISDCGRGETESSTRCYGKPQRRYMPTCWRRDARATQRIDDTTPELREFGTAHDNLESSGKAQHVYEARDQQTLRTPEPAETLKTGSAMSEADVKREYCASVISC